MSDKKAAYDEMYRRRLSLWFEEEGRAVAEDDIEVIDAVDVLWSGWECDSAVLMYRVKSTGERGLWVLDGAGGPWESDPVKVLRSRLPAYEQAISETKRFLERAKAEGLA